MINIKVGVCFNFIFNNTNEEWHFWQHHAEKWITEQVLHCLPTKFNKVADYTPFCTNGSCADMFFRFDGKHIDIIVIDNKDKTELVTED